MLAGLHLVVDEPGGGQPVGEAAAAVEETEPPLEMGAFEAASEGVAPTWYHFTLPFVGCFGVLLGGRLKGKRAAPSAGEGSVIT